MKEFSTRRSARLRWLGSEDCFCCWRQKLTSLVESSSMSSTSLPTSVSRLAARPDELLSACDIWLVCTTGPSARVDGFACAPEFDCGGSGNNRIDTFTVRRAETYAGAAA